VVGDQHTGLFNRLIHLPVSSNEWFTHYHLT
jgi:hypothetical protein